MKKIRSALIQVLKIVFSIGIIYWLIQTGRLDLQALPKLFSPTFFCIGILLIGSGIFLSSERWRILVSTQGIRAGRIELFRLSLIGVFFNFAMPGGVGGDIVKAYYFSKDHPGSKVVAISSVLMDRALGLYAMILMALLVMLIDIQHIFHTPILLSLFYFVLFLSVFLGLGLYLLFSKKIYERKILSRILEILPLSQKFLKLYHSLHQFGSSLSLIIYVIVVSFLLQMSSIVFLYLAGKSLVGGEIPFYTYFFVAPLGFMATALPISPAGVGVGQAAFLFLFQVYLGKETPVGATIITAMQMFSLIFGLLGAVIYLRRKEKISSDVVNQEMEPTLD